MLSTFMGLELGKRALQNSQQAMYIVQNNIANAENPDYSRQTVTMAGVQPLWMPGIGSMAIAAGQIGQGAYVASIDRIRDLFLDQKITGEQSSVSYFAAMENYVKNIESYLSEPDGVTLDVTMRDFFNAFSSLSLDPASEEKKTVLREKGLAMVNKFRSLYDSSRALQDEANSQLQIQVDKVNELSKQIAALNEQIMKIEATGQKPNDMLDQRDKLGSELSTYVPVSVKQGAEGFKVYIGGKILVQDNNYLKLDLVANPSNNGYFDVIFQGDKLNAETGSIKGIIDSRDKILKTFIEKINQLALSVTEGVNSLHLQGMNSKGETGVPFFKELPLTVYRSGEYDTNQDGINDSTTIYKIIGTKDVSMDEKLMTEGSITVNGTVVNYGPNDTVGDLIKRLNMANTGATFYINDGKLEVKGNASEDGIFYIKSLSDSGQFLSNMTGVLADGATFDSSKTDAVNTLFTTGQIYVLSPEKNIAGWFDLSNAVKNDVNSIAVAEPDKELHEGDGRIAQKISGLMDSKFMVRGSQSMVDFYHGIVTELASTGKMITTNLQNHEVIKGNLTNLRASYSGVNMDEELANMMKFQKAYQAAAKYISQQNELYDILMGIVK